MGTPSVEPVVPGEGFVERRGQRQPRRRSVHHGRSDGPVERGHRMAGHRIQPSVDGGDLQPVGFLGSQCVVVKCGDGGLELVLRLR
jgi:hypothetical protein